MFLDAFYQLFYMQRHVTSSRPGLKIAIHEPRNLHDLRSTAQYGAVLRSICRANRSRFEFPARCCAVPRSTARSVNAA